MAPAPVAVTVPTPAPVAAPALPPPSASPVRETIRRTVSSPAAIPKALGDFDRVLNIIAEEVGVDLAELQLESLFADFGLDSLLALTVAERIHDETGMNLPSTFFAAYPTVKDLQSLLDPEYNVPRDTPSLTSASNHDDDDESFDSSLTSASGTNDDFRVVIRQTIADETGTPAEELAPTTCLADIGVDSLLGLTIADCLSEALGAQISSSCLMENVTLQDIEATLEKVLALSVVKFADPAPVVISLPQPGDEIVSSAPHATSIVLRRAKGPGRALFLLPDGSGSAASYGSLARLDAHTTVYGLNCPWRTNPEEMTQLGVTTNQLVAKFTAEIQRLQPHGPYLLGGWSAGGIFAFEAARQLMAAGEVVEKLLLIDAPNPIGLENPPSRMFDFFESAGVFGAMSGNQKVPAWLRHHFDSVVNMLDGYVPRSLPNAPPTAVIYARDGICKDPSVPRIETAPDDPREMLWLLRDRTDFSAAGWATLVGAGNVTVQVLDNVNHFTMMNEGSHMDEMRDFVRSSTLGQ